MFMAAVTTRMHFLKGIHLKPTALKRTVPVTKDEDSCREETPEMTIQNSRLWMEI